MTIIVLESIPIAPCQVTIRERKREGSSGEITKLQGRAVEHNTSQSRRMLLHSRASAVDLQHLRYAVAGAHHGSFRRAAERLLLRQSKLSGCIRQLKERIEMTVFERPNGGVQVTPAAHRCFVWVKCTTGGFRGLG